MSVGEALSTWARCESGSPAAAADSGARGEEEERKASICLGLPGERLGQGRQSFYSLISHFMDPKLNILAESIFPDCPEMEGMCIPELCSMDYVAFIT